MKNCKHPSWNLYRKLKVYQCQWCSETKTPKDLQKFFFENKQAERRKNDFIPNQKGNSQPKVRS